jgi:plastocyanin
MARMRRWRRAATLVALAACLAASPVQAADSGVAIANSAFDPPTVTIQVGDVVTWTNQDSVAHTATATDGSFDTGQLANGAFETVTFDTAGTFAYVCSIHPQMTGSIAVEAASTGGGSETTPAPTDAVADDAGDGAWLGITLALALLGIVMLVGTVVADRRFRGRG